MRPNKDNISYVILNSQLHDESFSIGGLFRPSGNSFYSVIHIVIVDADKVIQFVISAPLREDCCQSP